MTLVMPTRILVVGGGGREHALAWKLGREPGVNEVLVAPGSAGIPTEPHVRVTGVDPLDPGAVVALAREHASELVVVGPEAPLAAGVADALSDGRASRSSARTRGGQARDVEGVLPRGRDGGRGPDRTGAGVRAAAGGRGAGVRARARGGRRARRPQGRWPGRRQGRHRHGIGRAGDRARALVPRGRPGDAPALVIEERLDGYEASVIAICDGSRAIALPAARDHKRLCDGDTGPNTGGMGAYSPLPDLDADAVEQVLETVHRPILAAMAAAGSHSGASSTPA